MSADDLERLTHLHDRLCDGDVSAVGAFFKLAAKIIERALQGRSRIDPDMVHDAITDTLCQHWQKPGAFDPRRDVPLHRYLIFIARKKLANLLRGEHRLKVREKNVANEYAKAERDVVATDPLAGYIVRERLQGCLAALEDERDRTFLRLLSSDVDDLKLLAAALGVDGEDMAEQERAVSRAKDRIRKRLIRRGLRE